MTKTFIKREKLVHNTETKNMKTAGGLMMIGLLLNKKEIKEIEYLIKRELDEILLDLGDKRIDLSVKKAMIERYKDLFLLLKRVASPKECLAYILQENRLLDEKI